MRICFLGFYTTFSSEIDTEDIRQLLHKDLSHLQRTNYNLQVLARQHGGNMTVERKIQTDKHQSNFFHV